jgi:stress response protein YsnF
MRVDVDARNVYVRLTKDQIKNSPEFDESTYASPEYRNRVGSYYGAMV